MVRDPFEALPFLQIAGKELCDDGDLGWLQAYPCGITRTARVHPIAIRWTGPGQQATGLILLSSPPPHTLSDQTPFVLSHGPANLEQQLIMGILTHGPISKLHLASAAFKFLHQQHLVDV